MCKSFLFRNGGKNIFGRRKSMNEGIGLGWRLVYLKKGEKFIRWRVGCIGSEYGRGEGGGVSL